MLRVIDRMVNSVHPQKNPEPPVAALAGAPVRRRMGVAERERQILEGSIAFFAEHGFGGQLRDLARSIGVTHALLYHYFPTKQALVDRVYLEVFEGKWRAEWEALLDDAAMAVEDKFTAFYSEYVNVTLTKEFTRILVFSGLSDQTITDRFFALLRQRLFPRLVRETRRYRGSSSRAKPSAREIELLLGLHGGFFYVAMQRWIYGQSVYSDAQPHTLDEAFVRDRVRAYLLASRELFAVAAGAARPPAASARKTAKTPKGVRP